MSATVRQPKVQKVYLQTSPTTMGDQPGTLTMAAVVPIPPRLLSLEDAATYLGVSPWTVRDLEHAGTLTRVRIPLPRQGELRKLLFDRADLDRLIEAWKAPSTVD